MWVSLWSPHTHFTHQTLELESAPGLKHDREEARVTPLARNDVYLVKGIACFVYFRNPRPRGAVNRMELDEYLRVIEQLMPKDLSEKWDNTGLLLEPSKPPQIQSVYLTNDLTSTVLDDAIQKNVQLVISYHPPIFEVLSIYTNYLFIYSLMHYDILYTIMSWNFFFFFVKFLSPSGFY
jgi:hypothetical protein